MRDAVRSAGRTPLLDRFAAVPPPAIRGRAAPLGVRVLRRAAIALPLVPEAWRSRAVLHGL